MCNVQIKCSSSVTLVLLTWIEFDGMSLNGKDYPGWAEGLGWFIELVPVSIAVLGWNSEFSILINIR